MPSGIKPRYGPGSHCDLGGVYKAMKDGLFCFSRPFFGTQRLNYHIPIDVIITPNFPQEPPLFCLFPVNGFCINTHHPIIIPVINHSSPNERFGVIDLPIIRNWDPRSDLCTIPNVLEEIKWWFNWTMPPYISPTNDLSAAIGFPHTWYSNKLIDYQRPLYQYYTTRVEHGLITPDEMAHFDHLKKLLEVFLVAPSQIHEHFDAEDWDLIFSAQWHAIVLYANQFAYESLPYYHQLFPPETQESHTDFFHPRAILTIKTGDHFHRTWTPVHPLARNEDAPEGSLQSQDIIEPQSPYQWATGQINYGSALSSFLKQEEANRRAQEYERMALVDPDLPGPNQDRAIANPQ